MMPQNPLAMAADYADAMLILRRTKNILFWALLLIVLFHASLFIVRISGGMPGAWQIEVAAAARAATRPGEVESLAPQFLHYLLGISTFVGICAAVVLMVVLLVVVNVMLIGRLVGVAHVMAALAGSVILVALLFPWQAFLNNEGMTALEFKVPGVLYTWNELALAQPGDLLGGTFESLSLKWSRSVLFPLAALSLLLWVQLKSRRGMRLALGGATNEAFAVSRPEP